MGKLPPLLCGVAMEDEWWEEFELLFIYFSVDLWLTHLLHTEMPPNLHPMFILCHLNSSLILTRSLDLSYED